MHLLPSFVNAWPLTHVFQNQQLCQDGSHTNGKRNELLETSAISVYQKRYKNDQPILVKLRKF